MARMRALMVTPLSGPLARYGRVTATALDLWARHAAALPRAWDGVDLAIEDSHPDPARALQRGLPAAPHLIFGPYGSGPARKTLTATRRVVWNHGGALSTLCWAAFPAVVNILAPASTYFVGAAEAVRSVEPAPGPSAVILHGHTGFAVDVARGAARAAAQLGFRITEIAFPKDQAVAAMRNAPEAALLLLAGTFEDELAAGGVLRERHGGAVALVAAGVDEVLASLGDRREGFLGPAQWVRAAVREVDEGPEPAWFATRYRAATGSEPAYPAVQAFAAGLIAARCLRDAGVPEDAALLDAARRLDCRTLYGRFRLDPVTGQQVGHRVRTVQWQRGRRVVVWPRDLAEQPLI